MYLEGYSGLGFPSNVSAAGLVQYCQARCCAHGNECVAFTLQRHSLGTGRPAGSCKLGEPCCWLVNAEGARHQPNHNDNCTSGYTTGTPPGPSPNPAPNPIPNGTGSPYTGLLQTFDRILTNHLANMVRETLPHGNGKDLQPCCGDVPGKCTCNYPSKTPP